MGNCKTITIEELKKDNLRFCLSALRVFGKCDECAVMKNYYTDKNRTDSHGVKPCESAVFSKKRLEYLKEKAKIKKEIKDLNDKLENLKGGLD